MIKKLDIMKDTRKDNRKTVGGWHWLYCYCEPVSPDDDIIYKGE